MESVVGSIGSGKSTFVNSATGSSLKVGHDSKLCTSAISVVCFHHDNARIYVVDTPGLNDKDRSDEDTCNLISEWFKRCVPEINFAGIVYLNRISDDGVKGKWQEKFFQQLCSGNYRKVTFATTMWDDLGQDVGSTEMHKQERTLKEYFASIFNGGAQLKRVDNRPKSAKDLLMDIIRDFKKDFQAVNVQKQLVADHKSLAEVKISADMDATLIRVIGAHKETLVRLSLEKHVEHSEPVQRILHKEYTKLSEELECVIEKLKARSA
ncbi:P-loop containing nucleoside triphosphate hydrolase protein [Panaeolus papilionaceus]|nr:P-loop containing nucleoside triphosphate hydrolase protein [Panaeolus papilionaceus]